MDDKDFVEEELDLETEEEGEGDVELSVDPSESLAAEAEVGDKIPAATPNTTQESTAEGVQAEKPNKIKDGTAEGINSAEDKSELIKKMEKWAEGKKISPEAFLSRTERMLLNGVDDAIRSGDLKSAQDMLAAVAENPASVKRVMEALRQRLQDDLTSVSWEQGQDNKGNAFVRLHIHQRDDHSKSSPSTSVMIGSDGTHTAQRRERMQKPTEMNASDALGSMYPPRRMRLDFENHRELKPIPSILEQLEKIKPATPATPEQGKK